MALLSGVYQRIALRWIRGIIHNLAIKTYREKLMRVDILTPPREGGPKNWARDLAMMLNDKGIDVKHIYDRNKLVAMLFSQKADIIHTTIPLPFGMCHKPMVLTIKGDYTIEHNMWSRYYPSTIRHAKAVTIPSQYLKGKLGLSDAVVIPNAILPENFATVFHMERKRIKLATTCNMYFADKASGLLRLFDILHSIDGFDFGLTVAGDGRHRKHIERRADGLNVNFMGYVSDVRPILRDTDIFLYYSTHDNFPNALLEAMASGLPVITNRFGAVGEIIDRGNDGHIADNDDDYESALRYFMHSYSLRQEMGKLARKTVEDKFDWHKVVDRYIEIYEGLA